MNALCDVHAAMKPPNNAISQNLPSVKQGVTVCCHPPLLGRVSTAGTTPLGKDNRKLAPGPPLDSALCASLFPWLILISIFSLQ